MTEIEIKKNKTDIGIFSPVVACIKPACANMMVRVLFAIIIYLFYLFRIDTIAYWI